MKFVRFKSAYSGHGWEYINPAAVIRVFDVEGTGIGRSTRVILAGGHQNEVSVSPDEGGAEAVMMKLDISFGADP